MPHTPETILSFCLRDNSVHLHDCSPFLVSIFIINTKKTAMFTVKCSHAILIGKALKHFLYVLVK